MCARINSLRRLSLHLVGGLFLVHGAAHAQTLGDLVEQAKRRQMQNTPGLGALPPAAGKGTVRAVPAKPLLWQLSGVDDSFEAVLIYRGKAVTVYSDAGQIQRIGPWHVVSIDAEGVVLAAQHLPHLKPVLIGPLPQGATTHPIEAVLPQAAPAALAEGAAPAPIPIPRPALPSIAPNEVTETGASAAPAQ